jgi:hypothetical protein
MFPISSTSCYKSKLIERESEKKKLGWGSCERHYRVGGVVIETKFGSFEGSLAVPASSSGFPWSQSEC